ncbi:dihydroneopterin triphosphate diphosphatase [Pseudoalteromonas sp. KS88]|uniref:dihydroneopterin triphosphate diphosphatase n=1 Tax=Pseudoalteromonas sp. KS88 TaxID=2109918 RepID=UPI00247816F6|nr:dihydroneopterin triphosphate diphosphatase [Pseudoalteromonas sp. KS88]
MHANFWQSVTSDINESECPTPTSFLELPKETGINATALGLTIRNHKKTNQYTIRESWRHRYHANALINTEHVFSICVPDDISIQLDPCEHTDYMWLSQQQAAEKAWSPSNRYEILAL